MDILHYKGSKVELRTATLPKYNCSNCKHYNNERIVLSNGDDIRYAIECANYVHPLVDCVLRGFEGHSEQPGLTNTLNIEDDMNFVDNVRSLVGMLDTPIGRRKLGQTSIDLIKMLKKRIQELPEIK